MLYRFKKPWDDGTIALKLTPMEPDRLAYLICASDGKEKAMIEEMRLQRSDLSRIKSLQLIGESDNALEL